MILYLKALLLGGFRRSGPRPARPLARRFLRGRRCIAVIIRPCDCRGKNGEVEARRFIVVNRFLAHATGATHTTRRCSLFRFTNRSRVFDLGRRSSFGRRERPIAGRTATASAGRRYVLVRRSGHFLWRRRLWSDRRLSPRLLPIRLRRLTITPIIVPNEGFAVAVSLAPISLTLLALALLALTLLA